ncbi:putative mitochondrial cytochrome c oxidase protein 20-like protein [Rosellinia necatrix]|uniref:Cytochrome c oxidase assembly protein COX20, mitochondrial n=1 Tax=Rosellinia necatrix TaxID=77044 RepID=A0A1S7UNJ4_ROSNE|nr:putative mitochondrial cytochrome c oxidase protein 20-like protein [Rosellinia necatrix]
MSQDDTTPPNLRGPPPGATEPPDHVKKPQIYEVFHSSTTPERSHIAGAPPTGTEGQPSKTSKPTFKEGMQSIKSDDFLKVHQIPCAREGFMTGIGAGAVVGVGRFVAGARAPKAANWAFGAFLLGSVIQWEYCQVQRRKERAAMARVVEVIDRKQAEKKAQAAEAARLKQEAEEKARQAQKRWYKFW